MATNKRYDVVVAGSGPAGMAAALAAAKGIPVQKVSITEPQSELVKNDVVA
jgi:flavin-dependent dehydrogenase